MLQPQEPLLIEGALVPAAPGLPMLQLFRTKADVAYRCVRALPPRPRTPPPDAGAFRRGARNRATSADGGRTWSQPAPVASLPNPDSKLHAVRLPNGDVVAVYNHHKGACQPRPAGRAAYGAELAMTGVGAAGAEQRRGTRRATASGST